MERPKVFIVSPIGSPDSRRRQHANRLLRTVIEPVMEALKCDAIRGDQITDPGRINDQIERVLHTADIVIADLRGMNPNVMYELGVRQGLNLAAILMAPAGQELPF